MRILHVVNDLNPEAGGPPRVAAQLSATMGLLGHQVTLISHRAGPAVVKASTLPDTFSQIPGIETVSIRSLPRETGLARATMPETKPALETLLRDHDVAHLHGVWDPILFQTAKIAQRLGVPYVVRPAGMLDPWSLQQHWLKKKVALALGYRAMLDRALFLHALNADERDLVGALGLRCPTEVIPNGTFPQWIEDAPPAGEFRAQYPTIGSKPFVLFLSRLHYKKGLDYLADAFKYVAEALPEVMLVVAGPDEGAQAGFEAQVRKHGLSSRVLMTGALYARQKLGALVDASCFCLPSRQEGFSVAIIEALAMGAPVVISRECHFPEVMTAGAGAITSLDAREIGAALIRVLSDGQLREQQSRRGITLIRENYTWPKIAMRCVAAYQRDGVGGENPDADASAAESDESDVAGRWESDLAGV